MPLVSSLATIVGIWLITVLSPGPNFFTTIHTVTTQSRRQGFILAAGIAVGTTIWATTSILGLGVLFHEVPWLYQAFKLAGGTYLVYLGVRAMVAARSSTEMPQSMPKGKPVTAAWAFRRGLIVDLSNPKAALFFTSLFAVAVPVDAPRWFDVLVVATVVSMAGGWYALVAWMVSLGPVLRTLRRVQRWLSLATGVIFIGLGVRLITSR